METTFEMCLSRTGISHMHTPSIAALTGGAGGGAYTLHTLQTSFRRAPEGIKPDISNNDNSLRNLNVPIRLVSAQTVTVSSGCSSLLNHDVNSGAAFIGKHVLLLVLL